MSQCHCPGPGWLLLQSTTDGVASEQLTVCHSSAGWVFAIEVTAQSGSGGSPPCLVHRRLLAVPSQGGKQVRELRRVPFIKAPIPFVRAAPS